MNAKHPVPEVTDALASIETQRLGREKRLGVPASCGWALRELYGLLGSGEGVPETAVESAAHAANVAAAIGAIERLRSLARMAGQRVMLQGKRKARLRRFWRDARSSPSSRSCT
ncbi:MAG TPA: hypothetical protein VFK92_04135 [Burkholderiales bacterium]|nr:hypothetical protein [Burkholderiales bacterium]